MLTDVPARQRTYSETIPPKSPTLVAKILVTNSPKLLPVPATNDMKRGSLQGSYLNLFKKPESNEIAKSDEDLFFTIDNGRKKREKGLDALSLKNSQRSSVRKSQNNLLKETGSKNLDNNTAELLRRGSLTTGALAETLDTSLSANKDNNNNSSRSLVKNYEGHSIKKNLMESNHLSNHRFLAKQKSVVVKEGFGGASPADGFFDSVGDNSRGDGRVLLSSTMRRRSCHCSDCGGISSMEKKHLHITIPCDRVQKRAVALLLSLKYQESQDNNKNTSSHSPGHSTPRQRGQSKDLTFSASTTQPPSTSKKFLTVASGQDKDKTANLSRFAAVAKKSFTTQAQFEDNSQTTTTAIGNTKSNVNVENPEDIGHHTATAGSDVSVKTPAKFLQKSKDSVENDGTPIKEVPSLARINSLEVDKDKKLTGLSKHRSTGEPMVRQDSFSPVNAYSPKSSTAQQARQLKPPLLMNVLASQKFIMKTRMSPVENYESHRFEDPKHLAQGFSRKVDKANRKPRNTLKLKNLSIIETYTNPVHIQSPLSANCKTVTKNSIMETLDTANSALIRTPDSLPRTSIKSKLFNMTAKKESGEPKSTFYKRSNTQNGNFLPNLVTGEVQKDIQSHREDIFKNPFKLEASQEVIFRLKQKRGQSIECPEKLREDHNNSPTLGGKAKKKSFKSKHRKNKSNPIMLEDIKRVYLPKSPGLQMR